MESVTAKAPVATKLSGRNNSTLESPAAADGRDYSHLEHATGGGGRDHSTLEPRAMEKNGGDYSHLEYTREGGGTQDPPVTAVDDRDYSTLEPSATEEGGEYYGHLEYAREGGRTLDPPIRRVDGRDDSILEPPATVNGRDYSFLKPPPTPPAHSAAHHYSHLELERARSPLPMSPPKTKGRTVVSGRREDCVICVRKVLCTRSPFSTGSCVCRYIVPVVFIHLDMFTLSLKELNLEMLLK